MMSRKGISRKGIDSIFSDDHQKGLDLAYGQLKFLSPGGSISRPPGLPDLTEPPPGFVPPPGSREDRAPAPALLEAFTRDILAVYERHGLAIIHDADQDKAVITALNDDALEWLLGTPVT